MRGVLALSVVLAGCAAVAESRPEAGDTRADAAAVPDTATATVDARPGAVDAAADPWLALDPCAADVLASLTLARIMPLARDTDTYRPPSAAMRAGVAAAVTALAQLRIDDARSAAATATYVVCRGEGGLVLLRPIADGTGHAFIALRLTTTARDLVLEAPHPVYDAATEAEAVAVFEATEARAVVIAGTHRCASDRASGCSGTADACGVGAAVRESDMAHAVDSVFHAAHLALADAYPTAWFVGVHGFGGPGVSVSNGTTDPVAATSRTARLAVGLHTRFGDEVTTCNDFGDPSITRDVRVCGTWDVQARSLHGSAMACTEEGSGGDRFVHVEQAPEYRPARAPDLASAILDVLR